MIKPMHPSLRHQLSCTSRGFSSKYQTRGVMHPDGTVLFSQTRGHCPWCSTVRFGTIR